MTTTRTRIGALLVAAMIAACQAPAGNQPVPGGTSPGPRRSPTKAPADAPEDGPRVVSTTSPDVAAPPTGPTATPLVVPTVLPSGLATPPGLAATLVGKVMAPPKLISDNGLGVVSNNGGGVVSNNGAGLISDNGLGLVANNGAGYRLSAAAEQVPVAGATVRLLDAAGRAVKDAAGKPVTTTTGADGAYAFTVGLPTRSLLVAVDIQGGELAGFVPKAAAAGAAPTVDIDLVSTLATGYVVRLFVQSQPDPLDVLDRLPAAAEAEARSLTAGAFAAGTVPVPIALTSERVVDAVRALRREAPALAGKLEEIRCLLVAAGQCSRGEGQLATTVPLLLSQALHVTPDGQLLVSDSLGSDRVWRVDDGGRARALIAGFSHDLGAVGPTDFVFPRIAGFTARGQAMVIDVEGSTSRERASLLGADGKAIALLASDDAPVAMVDEGAAIRILQRSGALAVSTGGQPARPDGTLRAADLGLAARVTTSGRDPAGGWWLAALDAARERCTIYRYDPATRGLVPEPFPVAPADAARQALDPAGHVFVQTAGNALWVQRRGAAAPLRLGQLPAGLTLDKAGPNFVSPGVVLGPDGAGYIGVKGAVYRIKDDQVTLAFGDEGKQVQPWSVAVAPDGTLFGVELDGGGLFRFGADGKPVRIAGRDPAMGAGGPLEGPAADVQWPTTRFLLRDAAGALYGASGVVQRLGTDGQVKQLLTFATAAGQREHPAGLALAAGGALWVGAYKDGGSVLQLYKVGADGQVSTAWGPAAPDGAVAQQGQVLSVGPDGGGGLFIAGLGKLWRWREGQEPVLVTAHANLARAKAVTADARGRAYLTTADGAHRIQRYDPATQAWTTLAGKGSAFFDDRSSLDTSLDIVDAPVAFDEAGNVYIADPFNRQIKKVPGGAK